MLQTSSGTQQCGRGGPEVIHHHRVLGHSCCVTQFYKHSNCLWVAGLGKKTNQGNVWWQTRGNTKHQFPHRKSTSPRDWVDSALEILLVWADQLRQSGGCHSCLRWAKINSALLFSWLLFCLFLSFCDKLHDVRHFFQSSVLSVMWIYQFWLPNNPLTFVSAEIK